jgi:triacylglycerol lipase
MDSVNRGTAAAVALLLVLAGASPAPHPPRGAQARPDPVLFVHGWRGNAAQWRAMRARFRADGWRDSELYAWTLEPSASNAAGAARIAARIDQILVATGAARVDIVAHSMGSLSSRHYLKTPASARKVDAWVSLGGPNHGTGAAEICLADDCREMRRGSPFLAALNRGDETPGAVRYATWWSPCDEWIDPPESAALDGAANHRTRCISHLELLRDSTVYRELRDFIAADSPSRRQVE